MSELVRFAPALAAGLLLGAIFFGGLWWTVRRGITSAHPVLWFMGSMLLRMGIVLSGFYFVAAGEWQRLLAALVGFVIARLLVLRLTRSSSPVGPLTGESADAP